MSVALTSSPPLIAFSGDRLTAEFTCEDIFSQVGNKAINKITIPDPVNVNYGIILKWGGKSVTMTAAAVPDSSGTQFFATSGMPVLPESQRQCFADNYLLSQDFIITNNGNEITLTAKQNGTLYNISGFLFSSGTVETLRPNYGIYLRLYLENIENNGYNLIGEYFHNVKVGPPHIVSAPIGDKLHTVITEDIRKLLPEIPFFGTMECKVSCRKYFFEYAETYNDQVRKVFTSDVKTVIHGGFSTLGKATKNISSEILLTSGIACFLKQGSRRVNTRTDQPQFLYFYNTKVAFNSSMQIKYYFTDGTVATKTLYSLMIQGGRKYGFNLQFDKVFIPGDYATKEVDQYEVWIQNQSGLKISESRFYVLDITHRPY
jgi:hypothetical protein